MPNTKPVRTPVRRTTRTPKPKAPKATKATLANTLQPEPVRISRLATVPMHHELFSAPPFSLPKPRIHWGSWAAWFSVGLGGILIVLGLTVLTSAATTTSIQPRVFAAAIVTQQPVATAISPLTGLPVTPETATRRPWAVVIENFPAARPQYGLSTADVVFESPTEGGITRFLAIFQSKLPTKLGPIRSARSYFNDWARGLAAIYGHSGGSEKALKQLTTNPGSLSDVNEFFNEAAYERDLSKNPPHNLFTSADRFAAYLTQHNFVTTSTPPAFKFTTQLPTGTLATTVNVPYSPAEYGVRYQYQPGQGAYQRLENGTTLADAGTQGAVMATNVVLLYTDIKPIADDALLRVELRTLGTGDVVLCTAGQAYAGTWRKTAADAPLELLDTSGNPLPLSPGNTWISVLDKSQAKPLPAAPASQTTTPSKTLPTLTP